MAMINHNLSKQILNTNQANLVAMFGSNQKAALNLVKTAQANQLTQEANDMVMSAYRDALAKGAFSSNNVSGVSFDAAASAQSRASASTGGQVEAQHVASVLDSPMFRRLMQSSVPPLEWKQALAAKQEMIKKINMHLATPSISEDSKNTLISQRTKLENENTESKRRLLVQMMKTDEGKRCLVNFQKQASALSSMQDKELLQKAHQTALHMNSTVVSQGQSTLTPGTSSNVNRKLEISKDISPQQAIIQNQFNSENNRKRKLSEVESGNPMKFALLNGAGLETLVAATETDVQKQQSAEQQLARSQSLFEDHPLFGEEQPPRPTITGGLANYRIISVPQVIRKPGGGEEYKSKTGSRFDEALRSRMEVGGHRERVGGDIKGDAGRAIKRNKLDELLNEIAPGTKLSDEVAEFVYDYLDEWIESVTRGACLLAKHRNSDRLEVRDLQLYLDKTWNIKIPGFGSDEIKSLAGTAGRKVNLPPGYAGRMQAVKEAMKGREKAK